MRTTDPEGLGAGSEAAGADVLEQFDAEVLGARLRALREAAGLTLREVAGRMGISTSAVSQIERGILRPSVHRLFALVTALDASLVDVFGGGDGEDPAPTGDDAAAARVAGGAGHDPGHHAGHHAGAAYVVRRAVEQRAVTLAGGVSFRRLSPGPHPDVDLFESVYPPGTSGSEATGDRIEHRGFEIGTVTSGELTIDFPDERVLLRAGDSISYACATPHRLSNLSADVTVATWLIVHPRPS